MTTLKPCPNPYCESHTDGYQQVEMTSGRNCKTLFQVECFFCETASAVSLTYDEAINAWNNLPRQPHWIPWDDEAILKLPEGSFIFIRYIDEYYNCVQKKPARKYSTNLSGYFPDLYYYRNQGYSFRDKKLKLTHYTPYVMPRD